MAAYPGAADRTILQHKPKGDSGECRRFCLQGVCRPLLRHRPGCLLDRPPTEKERRDIIKWSRGRRWQLFPYNVEEACWSDDYSVGGVKISVRHSTVATMECLLTDVLEHADPSLAKQRHIAALLSALPLSDPSLLAHWQRKAKVYPLELKVTMVRAHLLFRPSWEQEMLAERNNLLVLYESFCTIEKHILLVLMGLNRIYYPGWQWLDRLMGQMHIAPLNLSPRFKQVFGIVFLHPFAMCFPTPS